MRRKIRRKEKKQKKTIIVLIVFLVLFLSVGYAAFQTNVSLKAKGNVYNKGDLCYTTSDNGDGTVTIIDYDETCGTEVNIPSKIKGKTVTKIGRVKDLNVSTVFSGKNLTKVVIPDTVTTIGYYAFWKNNISSLDLGNGVQKIEDEAFSGSKISSIIFPKSLKIIGAGAFMGNYLTSVPSLDNIEYGGGAFSNNNLEPEDAFIYAKNSDGSIDYTTLNSYASKTYVKEINIPSNVKRLLYYSMRFANTSIINLPDGIEKIDPGAFMQTSSIIYNIPNSITTIDATAFSQSSNITLNIARKENAIEGSPWGAYSATVNWTGTN